MRRKLYPLKAVHALRKNEEINIETLFIKRQRELARAQKYLSKVQEAWREHECAFRDFEQASVIPEEGCSAAELQRRDSYREFLLEQNRALQSAMGVARLRCREFGTLLDDARRQLEKAHTAHQIIERHQERFETEERKWAAREAELECEEIQEAHWKQQQVRER